MSSTILFFLVFLGNYHAASIPMQSKEACVSAANRISDNMGGGYPYCVGTDGSVYKSTTKVWLP